MSKKSKTKVFLKYYHYDELKLILDQYINYATIIQKCKPLIILFIYLIKSFVIAYLNKMLENG